MGHITFVHGIANKPEPPVLLEQWRVALSDDDGVDLDQLGVTTSIVYWADLLYPQPLPAELTHETADVEPERAARPEDADLTWLADIPPDERAFVTALAQQIGFDDVAATSGDGTDPITAGGELEAIPLPPGLKRRLMRLVLRDVHHYLYDAKFTPRPDREPVHVRQAIRARAVATLRDDAEREGPHLLIGHSLGSVIAYDVLTGDDEVPGVDALLTVGSPLGISEVRERLAPPWTAESGWPSRRLADGPWVNVYDLLDPVCGFADRRIGPFYRAEGQLRVTDLEVENAGRWRHSIGKYLGQETLRERVRSTFA